MFQFKITALLAVLVCTLGCTDREIYVKDPVVQCYTNDDCNHSVCVLGQCLPGECTKDADCLPQAPTCMTSNVSLLRPIGTCGDDYLCAYEVVEEECEYGCNFDTGTCINDPCEGVSCHTPPNPCFGSQGWCENGGCVYPPRNDLQCDDGNPCTQNDTCSEGVCIGQQQECPHAKPDACSDENSLRTFEPGTGLCNPNSGLCDYQYQDSACEVGCGLIDVSELDGGVQDAENAPLEDGGIPSEVLPEELGPNAQCLPDLCLDVDCDDGNPCTEDVCDPITGTCSNGELNDQSACLTGADQCGEGRCIQGECVSFDNRSCVRPGRCSQGTCSSGECRATPGLVCQAEVDRDICDDMDVPGHCAATGECVPDVPPPSQCEGVACNGICLQCTIFNVVPITYCWEF